MPKITINEINNQEIKKIIETIQFLPDQIKQVLDESFLIKIPKEYSKITNVVVNGMGGSNLGARIIKSVFNDQINVPINIEPGYIVPDYVNENTLYLISSYSGTTEEPLSAYEQVKKRKAKIIGITSDNPKNILKKIMLRDNIPGYIFNSKFNPSTQPRMGVGYTGFGTAVLLAKAGLFTIQTQEIQKIINNLEIWDRELRPISMMFETKQVVVQNNPAKKIANKLYTKHPVIVGAEFLEGNIWTFKNHLCETGKNYTNYLILPELNHFAMEGLAYPENNKENLIFLFIDSKFYHPLTQKRSKLTKQIVKKNNIDTINYTLKGKTKLEQSFEMLQLGLWIAFYLSQLNNISPADIPWVDWFKNKMKNNKTLKYV